MRTIPRVASALEGCGLLLLLTAIVLAGGCSEDHHGGPPAPPVQPPAKTSVVQGSVLGGEPVVGATVAFVDSAAAADSRSLQPVEDLARTAAAQAVTGRDGNFSVEVPAGHYFIHVTPASGDDVHMPGGNLVRQATSISGGSVTIVTILLSEKPSDAATYVGSSTCLRCHTGHATVKGTLHFLAFRKLTPQGPVTSSLQDLSGFPNADDGLGSYPDGNPNDNTGSPTDGYGHRIATPNGFNILLGRDDAGYFQALETPDKTLVSEKLRIAYTYGGEGRFMQRYVTRLDRDNRFTADATKGTYHVLPAQFSETAGDPQHGGEVTVPSWVAYYPERWGPPSQAAGPVGAAPLQTQAFDNDCAGCHFTGMRLTRNQDGLFQAHAVADPGGPIDFDGDGNADEMNIGCERCHGPGSEHAANAGGHIIQPDYLPPGRAVMICGQCHTRGNGNGTIDGEGQGGFASRNDPDSGQIEFARAGMSPSEFYGTPDGSGILPNFGTRGGYFNPIDFATSASASWRDASGGFGGELNHSRENRQHSLDHFRARHFQNAFQALACWGCHDPHEREFRAQATLNFDNDALCLSCHAGHGDFAAVTPEMVDAIAAGEPQPHDVSAALDQHHIEKTFAMVGVAMNLGPSTYGNPGGASGLGRCTICHMPKTATSAANIVDVDGFVIKGDITSHTFDPISPETSEAMSFAKTDPVPNSCGDCHRGLLLGAYPDYRYK
jgi:predicted CXXCH cytochrome family protein